MSIRAKQQLLIATTNPGKVKEISHFLGDLPFEFLTLTDMPTPIAPPEETGETVEANAILKAKYYAEASGLLTLAEDSGLFVDALGGWPGVHSARVADTRDERIALVLERLKGRSGSERSAAFHLSLALYHPEQKTLFIVEASDEGMILEEKIEASGGFGYDPIFRSLGQQKSFAEMTIVEKNAVSHRGKALGRMKYILQNQVLGKHIVAPLACIIKDGKLLLARRNDPGRPEFHGKWEFPGGKMEMEETLHENVVREAAEEVGYVVTPVAELNCVWVEYQRGHGWEYQVYLIPFACRIDGGNGIHSDAEVLETKWFELDQVPLDDFLGSNARMYSSLLPELKRAIDTYHL